jgi:alkylated DNA repair dioxygenase AlkB
MDAANDFNKVGYVVLRNLVPANEVKRLYAYTLSKLELGNKDDGQVPGSPSFYQDDEVIALQKALLPALEKLIDKQLAAVFCYNRIYRKGAVLRMHKDSARAEISATINLGFQGETGWDLWLVDYNENSQKISLAPGDALLYHGSKLHHWRGKLEESDLVSQVMFHFVDAKGKNKFVPQMEFFSKFRKRLRKMLGKAY